MKMKRGMNTKTNITKRHLRKIIKEEIDIALVAALEEYSDLEQREENQHRWNWENSTLPVCKDVKCIPDDWAERFKADGLTRPDPDPEDDVIKEEYEESYAVGELVEVTVDADNETTLDSYPAGDAAAWEPDMEGGFGGAPKVKMLVKVLAVGE